MSAGLEWDDLAPLATAAYNFYPNCNAREFTFFLMFSRDPLVPLSKLIEASPRFLGEQNGVPSLEALQNTLQMVAIQIDLARKWRDKDGPIVHSHKVKENNQVMVM